MTEGYFYIWRSIQDNPLWKEKPFSKGQAWVDLIMMAQHSDGDIHIGRGFIIKAKRGDVFYGLDFLSKRWGWGKPRVIRFKEYLLTQKMANDVSDQRNIRHERILQRTHPENPQGGGELGEGGTGQAKAYPSRTHSAYPPVNILSIENYNHYQGEAIRERTHSAYPLNKILNISKDILSVEKTDPDSNSSIGKKKKHSTKRKTEKPNPEVKTFVLEWGESFSKKFNQPYTPNWGKEGKLVKEMLKIHPLPKLKELMNDFFSSQDSFIKNSGYTIGVFKNQLNKLIVERETDPFEQAKRKQRKEC